MVAVICTVDEIVRTNSDSVNLPVIADADTAYGNAINLMRTVHKYERTGVAAIHIEDQAIPKKCGHMEGKHLISVDEMVGKIRAATEARQDPNFIIIARTDARSVLGFDETVSRAKRYVDAGADMIFGEALQSREELMEFAKLVNAPLFTDSTEWGKTPLFSVKELGEFGYKIVIFSTATLRVVHKSVADLMLELKLKGTQTDYLNRMKTRQETYELLGYPEYVELENRYLPLEK